MPKPVVLFLAANPLGTTQLTLMEECAAITREIKMTPGRAAFDFQTRWAVTIDDLSRELNELRPTLIHFSGHANANGIALLGKNREAQLVAPAALAGMITSTESTARAVVLNACYSDDQAEVLSKRLGCAVGMRGAVDDDAASEFSVAFYRAIGHGHSIYDAFLQAESILVAKNLEHVAAPCCKTRPNVDASKLVLYRNAEEPAALLASTNPQQPPAAQQTNIITAGGDIHTTPVGGVQLGPHSNFSLTVTGSK